MDDENTITYRIPIYLYLHVPGKDKINTSIDQNLEYVIKKMAREDINDITSFHLNQPEVQYDILCAILEKAPADIRRMLENDVQEKFKSELIN